MDDVRGRRYFRRKGDTEGVFNAIRRTIQRLDC